MSKNIRTPNEPHLDLRKTAILAVCIIIGLWLITLFSLSWIKSDLRGTFGDMFGSVNALFSGLALAGIILTILMQRQELEYQRDELQATRKEFETQNETLKLQRFENTFFSLLNLHHQIVNAIDYKYYKKKEKGKHPAYTPYVQFDKEPEELEIVILQGRDVFRHTYRPLSTEIKNDPSNFISIYLNNYTPLQSDLGHYFRNLYRMFKLVNETDFFYDKSQVSIDEEFNVKYNYTSIIRSQLSDYELAWLFYNCLSKNGIDKFKPLIEKYTLLKNLPDILIPDLSHKKLYDESAFISKLG